MASIVDLAGVVVDCADAGAMVAFYRAACGGEVVRRDDDSAWLRVGGVIVVFREVAGYRAPTWPAPDVPTQVHLDFVVDDLDEAERLLRQHGAAIAGHQPHRERGLLVMLDPAGHPFCIARRSPSAG